MSVTMDKLLKVNVSMMNAVRPALAGRRTKASLKMKASTSISEDGGHGTAARPPGAAGYLRAHDGISYQDGACDRSHVQWGIMKRAVRSNLDTCKHRPAKIVALGSAMRLRHRHPSNTGIL
jgi:hypothetical protein